MSCGERLCSRLGRVGCFPLPLAPDDRPFAWRAAQFDISFRLGVGQTEKLRESDDLKHSVANSARSVHTPIQLVSWDHIAQLPRFRAEKGGDLVMFKTDHESAYKQMPIDPDDRKNAIVSIRDPSTRRRHGFVSRTLVFGSVDAVLHYNVLSRILTALTNRCLGIPLVGYFGDFAALIRLVLGDQAIEVPPFLLSSGVSAGNREIDGRAALIFSRPTGPLSV